MYTCAYTAYIQVVNVFMNSTNRQAKEIHFHSDDLLEFFRLQRQVLEKQSKRKTNYDSYNLATAKPKIKSTYDLPLPTTIGDNQGIQGNHNGLGLAHRNQTLSSNN